MSRAEKIRGKFFGGTADKATNGGEDVPVSRSSSDVPLTIQIPKPPPTQPAPPKKADSSPRSPRAEPAQRPDKCYRERLVQKLGPNYHGAERHRLVQDASKELHWKRWGPYVSDRQWVSLFRHSARIDVRDIHRDPRVLRVTERVRMQRASTPCSSSYRWHTVHIQRGHSVAIISRFCASG